MYRIKLANGTILEFDSLASLTVDIHASVVKAEALIFHQRANQWLPIHVHPAWKQALATPRKSAAAEPMAPNVGVPAKAPSAVKPPASRIGAPPKPDSAPRPGVTAKMQAAPVAKAAARPGISVEHLDEELELLGIDELDLPGQSSAAVAVLARPTQESSVAAPAIIDALVAAPERLLPDLAEDAELLELLPAVEAAPAPTPAPSMALPASLSSAETLVPRTDLLIEPVDESTALREAADASVDASVPSSNDITGDLSGDFPDADTAQPAAAEFDTAPAGNMPSVMEDALPPAEPVAEDSDASGASEASEASDASDASVASEVAMADASAPEPSPWESANVETERTTESAGADTPAASFDTTPRAAEARPSRLVWYAGGAAAAAGILIMLALRTGNAGATRTPPADDATSANPGMPGAPLKPPAPILDFPSETAPTTGSSATSGRIEPPADIVADTPRAEPTKETAKEKGSKAADITAKKSADAAARKTADDDVVLAPVDIRAMTPAEPITVKFDVAPNVLAARYVSAQDAAWNDLSARLRVAGFDNLFGASRVAPAGAATARAAVAAARAHIAQWRTRAAVIDKAYRDSTSALIAAGAWSATEQREWEGRARHSESGEAALEANAVLSAADRLYGILAANGSAYEVIPDGLRFSDSGAQRQYWESRRALVAAIGAASSAEPKTPLAAILKAIGAARPPEGLNTD
jgi:hypothetical protein